MSSRWWGILVSILFALPALAQDAVASRLDAVQKSGKLRICTPGVERAGSGAARVYAANTGGAIVGSLFAGFVLIPAFGSRNSLVVLAALFDCVTPSR